MTTVVAGGEVLAPASLGIGDVVLAGDRIDRVDGSSPAGTGRRFDAAGLLVAPGFIDLQVNGAAGIDITTEPDRIGEVGSYLATTGVTAFLPTVITCATERRAAALAAVRLPVEQGSGAVSLGLHLEGPMLATARRGAHPERWLTAPSAALVDGWSRATGVAMVTIAPELPGALDVIGRLVDADVVVSIGHTAATAEVVEAAIDAGATAVTHLFNAMAPLGHRAPGPVGVALGGDRVVAGLICDGIHVDPLAVRLAWRALGPARCALVSDATAALGLAPGSHHLGDADIVVGADGVRTRDGTLAGSDLSLDRAVRNLMAFTGCAVADAIASVTATPARLLGLADRGELVTGHRADVVVLDRRLTVVATFVGGELVHLADGEAGRWRS